MKEAIQKAIEGGYKTPNYGEAVLYINARKFGKASAERMYESFVLLDPLFWQALDKAMGWKEFNEQCPVCDSMETLSGYTWSFHWHHFIDYLAEGKDAESFFKELLK